MGKSIKNVFVVTRVGLDLAKNGAITLLLITGDHDRLYPITKPCYASPMTRIARVVVPGLPHHVTQRGNRRERIFFEDGDYVLYRDWLGQSCRRFGVEVRGILPDAQPRSPDPDA